MGEIVENVGRLLAFAEARVASVGQNLANSATSGFKRGIDFSSAMSGVGSLGRGSRIETDFSPGKESETSNPTDLAISGSGFFVVRSEAGRMLYTRNGAFSRDADGHLISGVGLRLQLEGGGDLQLKDGAFTVASDGVVTQGGQALGRIAVARFSDTRSLARAEDGAFTAEVEADGAGDATIRQGALESSNVSNGEEMVAMMEAMRRAETGQRLMQVYDDLMGRAITAFGQA